MLNEIHLKTNHTNTGGNVYQCAIFFSELSLFLPSKWRIPFIAVGQTFLGLKELFYSLFEDLREKLVYGKINQLRTRSSITQTFCASSSFHITILVLAYYFHVQVENAHKSCFGCIGSINYWRPFCCSGWKNLIACSWKKTSSSVFYLRAQLVGMPLLWLVSRNTPNKKNFRII